jgi:hypothetical protein
MNTTTSYIIAAVSVGCICLIRVFIIKIRSCLSKSTERKSDIEMSVRPSKENTNNSDNINKKNPIFI